MILSLVSPWTVGVNQGIDMTGGIQMEYSVSGIEKQKVISQAKSDLIDKAQSSLSPEMQNIITDTNVYWVSGLDNIIVETGIDESVAKNTDGTTNLDLLEKAKQSFATALQQELSTLGNIEQTRYVNIGASFGDYIKSSGYKSLIGVILAISLYILYAFRWSIAGMVNWPFSVVTALTLFHDVLIAFGLYVLISFFFPEFKIDTFFITAMLTVLGYSINDTIVVMDRIRSNLKDGHKKWQAFKKVIDASIHGTIRRSLFTSITVVMVLISMFLFGPDSIRGFTLALMLGTIVGTYSSICIAAPLLYDMITHTNKKSK